MELIKKYNDYNLSRFVEKVKKALKFNPSKTFLNFDEVVVMDILSNNLILSGNEYTVVKRCAKVSEIAEYFEISEVDMNDILLKAGATYNQYNVFISKQPEAHDTLIFTIANKLYTKAGGPWNL
jgi:hypothetical protein